MTTDLITEPGDRLREARIAAGFKTATEAAEKFGWKTPTFISHENKSRGFRPKDAQKYARAFNTDAAWLLTGRRKLALVPKEPSRERGLEDRIEAYIPPRDGIRMSLSRLSENLAPSTRVTQFLVVPHHYPGLCLMKGDVIVIDQRNTTPEPGQIVVCQVVDTETGEGETKLRIYGKAGPVAPLGEADLSENQEQSVIGSVIYSLRGAPGV